MSTVPHAWLFTRGHESVRIVRDEQPGGFVRLTTYGQGKDVSVSQYADVTECVKGQAAIEQALVREGFRLQRGSAERRISDEGMWHGSDQRWEDTAATARKIRAWG